MELEKENNNEKQLVCNKGNMLLESYIQNGSKAYILNYNLKKLDPNKVNIKALMSTGIYELLEKINPELIEKIHILKIYNEDDADILILLKHIAKEIGIKQKYILFRTSRIIDFQNSNVTFINKDISLIDKELEQQYITTYKLGFNGNYEKMTFNYGKTLIKLKNLYLDELLNLTNDQNFVSTINLDFVIDFQMLLDDELPIYMENLIGLMFKKMFYNLKLFINNLNK